MQKRTTILFAMAVAILFAGCRGETNKKGSEPCKMDSVTMDTLDINDEGEYGGPEMFKNGKVITSEDGRVQIESGICPGGGTAYECWAIWTITDSKGQRHQLHL